MSVTATKMQKPLIYSRWWQILLYSARELEQLLYGEVSERIPVGLFTDSEYTLESVASLKQIVTKTLRMTIVDLKEGLLKGEIASYSWLPKEQMSADLLTKEKKIPDDLENVLLKMI